METTDRAVSMSDAETVMRCLRTSGFDTEALRQTSEDIEMRSGFARLLHAIREAPWSEPVKPDGNARAF